jgi:hypothetical protein
MPAQLRRGRHNEAAPQVPFTTCPGLPPLSHLRAGCTVHKTHQSGDTHEKVVCLICDCGHHHGSHGCQRRFGAVPACEHCSAAVLSTPWPSSQPSCREPCLMVPPVDGPDVQHLQTGRARMSTDSTGTARPCQTSQVTASSSVCDCVRLQTDTLYNASAEDTSTSSRHSDAPEFTSCDWFAALDN